MRDIFLNGKQNNLQSIGVPTKEVKGDKIYVFNEYTTLKKI